MELWPIDWPASVDKTTLDPATVALAELAAANAMRFLTLYRVGGSPITVRPCGSTCRNPHYFPVDGYEFGAGFHPYLADNGMYANCWCGMGCRCDEPEGFRLEMPVGEIISIRIDGVLVPATEYYVVNGDTVVRNAGSWPGCRSRVEVRYRNGYKVDVQGQYAAGILAHEFYKAAVGDQRCRLPSNITNITRAGVTMAFQTGMFPDMLTGIKEVDTYLVQWNPNAKRQASSILSLDMPNPTVVTWP